MEPELSDDLPEHQGCLAEDELADIMAMFPDVDFGRDHDDQLIIYTGRVQPPTTKENENDSPT